MLVGSRLVHVVVVVVHARVVVVMLDTPMVVVVVVFVAVGIAVVVIEHGTHCSCALVASLTYSGRFDDDRASTPPRVSTRRRSCWRWKASDGDGERPQRRRVAVRVEENGGQQQPS